MRSAKCHSPSPTGVTEKPPALSAAELCGSCKVTTTAFPTGFQLLDVSLAKKKAALARHLGIAGERSEHDFLKSLQMVFSF